MGGVVTNITPVVSKIYCSSSQTTLMVRMRPRMVNGGGFVVMNSGQNVVFKVDGCGILGIEGELILRDGNGAPILLIRKKVITLALNFSMLLLLCTSITEIFHFKLSGRRRAGTKCSQPMEWLPDGL